MEFEIKKLFQTGDIFLLNSGRSAILLGLKSLQLKTNSEIILTSFNCSAVIDPIINLNLKPVFVDTNRNGGIDINDLKKKITKNTKAIICTHPFGILEDLKGLQVISKKNNLYLFNDLAQSINEIPDSIDKYGDFVIYSFGPEKHIFSLGGGALKVNNKKLLKRVQKVMPTEYVKYYDCLLILLNRWKYYFTFWILRNFPEFLNIGQNLNLIYRFKPCKESTDITDPEVIKPLCMNGIQMHLLLNKIRNYFFISVRNRNNFEQLKKLLSKNIMVLGRDPGAVPLYATILVDRKSRYELSKFLSMRGIQTVWNYLPLYFYKAYTKFKKGNYPNTESLWVSVLSLPFRYPLDQEQIKYIAEVVNGYYK